MTRPLYFSVKLMISFWY